MFTPFHLLSWCVTYAVFTFQLSFRFVTIVLVCNRCGFHLSKPLLLPLSCWCITDAVFTSLNHYNRYCHFLCNGCRHFDCHFGVLPTWFPLHQTAAIVVVVVKVILVVIFVCYSAVSTLVNLCYCHCN